MATTSVSYNGDGVDTDFDITFAYTSRNFVKAYVNGVITTAWAFLDADTVRFTVAPSAGTANVELRRVTSTTPLVDFVAAASITDTDLDLAILQQLHILEENQNNSLVGMQQSGGNWDATSDRIVNLSLPLASTDAASKAYVDSITGSVADAEAAQAAAESAEDGAVAQAAAAAVSAAAASASASAASSSASSISTALPVTGLTVDEVPVATGAATYDAITIQLRKLLSTGSASAQATVDLALSASYNEYVLEVWAFNPSTDANLNLQFSIDSGATYKAGASDYNFDIYVRDSANSVADSLNSTGATALPWARAVDSARISQKATIRIFAGNGSSLNQTVLTDAVYQSSNGAYTAHSVGGGEMDGFSTKATHIRLLSSSGNISLSYALYGVVR